MTLEIAQNCSSPIRPGRDQHVSLDRSTTSPPQSPTLSEPRVRSSESFQRHRKYLSPHFANKRRHERSSSNSESGSSSPQPYPSKKIMSQVNWQAREVENDLSSAQVIEEVRRRNAYLEQQCRLLKQNFESKQRPQVEVLHRVRCSEHGWPAITIDIPTGFGASNHLRGQDVVPDLNIYIAERRSRLILVVFKNYTCCMEDIGESTAEPDSILKTSSQFAQYLTELTNSLKKPRNFFPLFEKDAELSAPFHWYY